MTRDFTAHLREIAAALSPAGSHVTLAGLRGSAPAYLLSRLRVETEGPFLVVTADSESADEICRELRFYAGEKEPVLYFPPWDTTPFEQASPHPDVTGQRLNTLARLMEGSARVVVAPLAAVIQRVLPRRALGQVSQYLVTGEEVAREELLAKLVNLGYANVPLVEDRGTFSIRGGILDIFPPDLPQPVRIEFFGDFVDTVRTFDPVTQRSLHPLTELVLLPSREIILPEEKMPEFAARLKSRCDDLGLPADRRRGLLEQLQNSFFPPGIEYLQPLFHPDLETLFDYAGTGCVLALVDPVAVAATTESFAAELAQAEQRALERDAVICAPAELFLSEGALAQLIASRRRLSIPYLEITEAEVTGTTFRFTVENNSDLKLDLSPDSEAVLKPLVARISDWLEEKARVIMACHQRGQSQRLHELLAHYTLPLSVSERDFPTERTRRDGKVDILVGDLSRGFRLREEGLVVIAEEEIFGRRIKRRGISETRKKQILTSLAELKPGDYMVHLDFGVGIYRGLQHIALQ
ncbi:MAG TPA: transcription-repair coupling factor, partial [Geobacteraceae bacterium]|nr:transcription-repair coupling factor [Geobacteraceae bacterium]